MKSKRCKTRNAQTSTVRAVAAACGVALALALAGCGVIKPIGERAPTPIVTEPTGPAFQGAEFSEWSDADPVFRFLPGDEVDVTVISAPELSRQVRVGADGRIFLPFAGPIVAADRSVADLQDALTTAYAAELRDPLVEVQPRTLGARQVFVGGDVGRAGIFDMPGEIDALQALIMAGGATNTGDLKRVVIIRRARGGAPMMKIIDLDAYTRQKGPAPDFALQRFDVVYVPKKRVVEIATWVQQNIRDIIPVTFSVSYNLGNNNR
jgi:protein involved in polysaccharide export with SLBB domain